MISRTRIGSTISALALISLTACGDPAANDFDKDGLIGTEDCNDSDANVGGPLPWYTDSDSDGYGDIDSEVLDCSAPNGTISEGGDCDDDVIAIHPGANEVCDDVDNDCDGTIDQEASDATVWYADADSDGFGSPDTTATSCTQPTDHVEDDTDCDDTDPLVFPGANEIYYDGIDYNCDPADEYDADGDGVDSMEHGGTDCDDQNANIYDGAIEICDGFDNDCDITTAEDGVISLGVQAYSSIQDAIDAATTGDSITVCDGSYFESLTIDEELTLSSLNGATATILSAATTGGAPLVINISNVVVDGFTLTGGSGNSSAGMMLGGGLHFTSSSGLTTLKNSVIQNNLADRGAGIYTAGNLHLEDVIIKGNTALENGGGIYSESDLTVRKSSIESNAALLGGGIYTTGTALAVSLDSDTIITGNTATDAGGGVVLCGDCNLDNGTISENEADIGGGLYLDWTTAPGAASHTVSGCMIKENIAQSAGGGMFINGSVDLQGTTVDNNSVTNTLTGEGGGIYQDSGALVLSGGSVIQRNSAAFGAGLYAIGSAIDGGQFEANQASDSGGGIYIGGEFGTSLARVTIRDNSATNRGGGLFSSSYMKSVDAEIISNTANQGGAIYADAEAALMTFDSASILSNTATTGGAIFLENGLVTLLLCDLGEGSTENIADDVYIGNIYGQSYTGYSTNTVVNCDTSIGSCL